VDKELTITQLEIVCHVANGLRYEEIATVTNRSESSVKQIIGAARERSGAKTISHLVSMVIASGVLEWQPDVREHAINGKEYA
jgi:DNA-binding CsgD family transcriptional regulator